MTIGHPSDSELQQYAMDVSGCAAETIRHIKICENCQLSVKTYQHLVMEISEEPKPVFDFDVSALVLSQIPKSKTNVLPIHFFASIFRIALFCLFGIPLYLFRKYILNLFTEVSPFFIYIIVPVTIIIVFIKIKNMYKTYQKQMELLKFY